MRSFDYPAFLAEPCYILLFHHSVESGKHCCMNDDQITAEELLRPLSNLHIASDYKEPYTETESS